MMKTQIRLYSRSAEPEELEPWERPKDPTFVDVRDLCVPLDECATVGLGPVDPSVCKWLAENRFDQAPVQVPSAEFGWRLIARSELERLVAEGHPLTNDPARFQPNDDCMMRLERGLARLVSAAFKESWDWIRKLSEEKQARILGYMDLSQRRGVDHEPVAAAMLPELFNIIASTPELLRRLEYRSSKECDKVGRRIANVRNRVMHPVRPLVLGQEDVVHLSEVIKIAEELGERAESAVREIVFRSAS